MKKKSIKISILLFLSFFCIAVTQSFAVKVKGEWELIHLSTIFMNEYANEKDLENEKLKMGDQLALLLAEDTDNRPKIIVAPEEETIELPREKLDYTMKGDHYVLSKNQDSMEIQFVEIGDRVLCLIIYRIPNNPEYMQILEAIPKEGAEVVSKLDSSKEESKESEDFILSGSSFVNKSKDIVMKFREKRVVFKIMGMQTGAYTFERQGNYIYVNDPEKGTVEFKIVNKNTLICDQYGLEGSYNRR